MTIKVEIDLNAEDLIDELQDDVMSSIFGAVQNARVKMQRRSQRGTDVNGREFKKYSKSYAEFKEKKTGKSKPVDLTLSGEMWKQIKTQDPKLNGDKVVCEVKSTTPKASDKIIENEKRGRKFFDFNEDERDQILADIREQLNR